MAYITELPNLDHLRSILADAESGAWAGHISLHNDQRHALTAALRLLSSLQLSEGTPCGRCGTLVPNLPSTATPAPITCPACIFWQERTLLTQTDALPVMTLRAEGVHYVVSEDADGPTMTVRLHDGTTIVTPRLRCQGPVPADVREALPDNAIVSVGNDRGLRIGIHRG